MVKHTENCMVCGRALTYFESVLNVRCHICGVSYETNASCEDGHYVCDSCHSEKGLLAVSRYANETGSSNPITIATEMMKNPAINMHGPEHHYLIAASLLAAYKNIGKTFDFDKALRNILQRAKKVPGGICGAWGSCGASISTGIFVSVITGATSLSVKEWSLANKMTSESLALISANGGPRCCKRNSYLAILQATAFIKEHFDVALELSEQLVCEFSQRNNQCKKTGCLFFPPGKTLV